MNLLKMTGITKRYPGTVALDNVDFWLDEGEIVSLLGENGAGKTTLMKVLYGMTKPDAGVVEYKGEKRDMRKPADAIDMGICMVHQHFMLVPAFTVAENIVVGSEPHNGLFFDMQRARDDVAALIEQFHFNIDPDALVEKLSVGEQQRVEILKALYRKADVIILDEPTAVLTPKEVEELFDILRQLNAQKKSFIIITHKLKETMALASRIAVLRDGKITASDLKPSSVTVEFLSEMMVGRKVDLGVRHSAKEIGSVSLEISDLNLTVHGKKKLNNINFQVHKGEILGIAGIEGNGQSELIKVLTGCLEADSVNLTLEGKALSGNARTFLMRGVAHVPEDRLKQGLVGQMSIEKNLILGYHTEPEFNNKGLLKSVPIKSYGQKLKDEFLIKAPSAATNAANLSGGNQQKIVIARAFSRDPKVLIIANPTRGVDIGAIEYIHSQMISLRDTGKAILLISPDLDEVRTLSDRILVLYEGSIVSKSMPGEMSEIEMGLLMTGGTLRKEEGV